MGAGEPLGSSVSCHRGAWTSGFTSLGLGFFTAAWGELVSRSPVPHSRSVRILEAGLVLVARRDGGLTFLTFALCTGFLQREM